MNFRSDSSFVVKPERTHIHARELIVSKFSISLDLDSSVYHEKVWLSQWMSIAMGLLIAILTPLILLQLFAISKEPYLFGLYFFLDLFFIFLFINFRMMKIVIYPQIIHVSFGIIRKKIMLSEVLTCEPVSASMGVYTGAGIRFGVL